MKPDRGQGGWGISIFNSSALIDWYQNQKAKGDLDFILQPYLSDAEEFRTFFILDESWTLRRSPADDAVAANFRQTGSAVKARAPEPITRQIEQLISLSGASYGAIDYFVINGELFILELNVVPGLEQLEQVTGENIMAKLVRKLLSFG